jgi:hypothetical protein
MSAVLATNGQFGTNYVRQHARQVNARYLNNAANVLTAKERFNQVLAGLPATEKHNATSKLKAAISQFQRQYPNIKSFNDPAFRICRALPVRLSDCCIDTTIQRHLDIDWVIKIVTNFTAYQAMPIQMYRVGAADLPQSWDSTRTWWAAWDGQHTLVAFYIIAVMIFGEDPQDVMIPMVEYDMQNRLECRVTFMKGNSKEGKKVMEPIDLAMQQIYACKLDGVTWPAWKAVEAKHDALAAHDLFLTASKFHDQYQPGAISRTGDIVDEKFSVDVIRQFSVYADHVLARQQRAIDTKELPIIMGFLRMAANDNCNYNDAEIQSLADLCLQLFDANFDESGPFWAQVGQAYMNWHVNYYANMQANMRPGMRLNKDWIQGGTFFWHQLRNSWLDANGQSMRMPQLNIQTSFYPNQQDLF